jgi:hypothetical protein
MLPTLEETNCSISEMLKVDLEFSSFLESVLFPFIEKISLGASQVDNFGAAISIFLLLRALSTVVSIGYSRAATDDTTAFVRAVIAFIADVCKDGRTHVAITNDAFAITWKSGQSLKYRP